MRPLLALAALFLAGCPSRPAVQPDTRLFEMRVYYAAPGKLDALHARFRDHTCALFERHGMTNLGYFVPEGENPERKLVYFLAFPDRAARDKAFRDFGADPDWRRAVATSEAEGKLVARIDNAFLRAADFSPRAAAGPVGRPLLELRTYTTEPGRLPSLLARFRDHTLRLFERHGMVNLPYWVLDDNQGGARSSLVPGRTLLYLLAHRDRASATASFAAFRADPDWLRARADSEKAAGGSLTVPEGVRSEFLVPTDYSRVK